MPGRQNIGHYINRKYHGCFILVGSVGLLQYQRRHFFENELALFEDQKEITNFERNSGRGKSTPILAHKNKSVVIKVKHFSIFSLKHYF